MTDRPTAQNIAMVFSASSWVSAAGTLLETILAIVVIVTSMSNNATIMTHRCFGIASRRQQNGFVGRAQCSCNH